MNQDGMAQSPPRIQEVANGIFQMQVPIPDNPLGYLLSYLLIGEKPTLIDTGWDTPEAFVALEQQVGEVGLSLKEISQIVVTHLHPDHYGLAQKIKEVSGAPVLMHRLNASLIEQRFRGFDEKLIKEWVGYLAAHGVPTENLPQSKNMPVMSFSRPLPADEALEDGDIINAGDRSLRVVHTPGHSPDHICLYDVADGIFFSGDHVLPCITPNIGLSPQFSSNPLGDYMNSLEELTCLDVRLVLPAHEYTFLSLAERAREIQHHHHLRLQEIIDTIDVDGTTAFSIASRLHWNLDTWDRMGQWDKHAALMEVLAHLELLKNKGNVKANNSQGGSILFYNSAE